MPARFESFINSVEGNEGERCHYSVRMDTYGCGCQHNCGYCYARSLLAFRGLWNPQLPATADIRKIRNAIVKKLRPGDVVRLGGMTDCFQPIERGRKLTYRTIEMLNRRRVHYLIVTKSALVATEPYLEILDPELAHIQVSITTTDATLSKRIEPGAPVPDERFAAAERLQAGGFDVSLRLSPYIPEFVDMGTLDVDMINAVKCDKMLIEFLRVSHWIERWLSPVVDLSAYSLSFHGYKHLPFEKKRDAVRAFEGHHEITVCDFEEKYLDYWKKEYNPNPDDCCNLNITKHGNCQIEH